MFGLTDGFLGEINNMTPLTAHDAKSLTEHHSVYTTLESIFEDIKKASIYGKSNIDETLKMVGCGLSDAEVEHVASYLRGMGYEVIVNPKEGITSLAISWEAAS